MTDLLSAAYDAFGHCSKCGSDNVTPSTEKYHVSGQCVAAAAEPRAPGAPSKAAIEAALKAFGRWGDVNIQ